MSPSLLVRQETARTGNSGSQVDGDLKLVIKIGRQNGIHVTPTAVLDGLIDPSISSSYGAKEWKEWFDRLS
jgi:protein-disulfide isomerase